MRNLRGIRGFYLHSHTPNFLIFSSVMYCTAVALLFHNDGCLQGLHPCSFLRFDSFKAKVLNRVSRLLIIISNNMTKKVAIILCLTLVLFFAGVLQKNVEVDANTNIIEDRVQKIIERVQVVERLQAEGDTERKEEEEEREKSLIQSVKINKLLKNLDLLSEVIDVEARVEEDEKDNLQKQLEAIMKRLNDDVEEKKERVDPSEKSKEDSIVVRERPSKEQEDEKDNLQKQLEAIMKRLNDDVEEKKERVDPSEQIKENMKKLEEKLNSVQERISKEKEENREDLQERLDTVMKRLKDILEEKKEETDPKEKIRENMATLEERISSVQERLLKETEIEKDVAREELERRMEVLQKRLFMIQERLAR